ncbi:MAG: hypothetical protein AAF623_00465 [Planctomycetota bacterium]
MDIFMGNTTFFDIFRTIEPEPMAAIFILGVIGFFATLIVTVSVVATTIKSISVTRMQMAMVKELLKQGHSIDEVERLVYGPALARQFGQLVRNASDHFSSRRCSDNAAMPPVKQTI